LQNLDCTDGVRVVSSNRKFETLREPLMRIDETDLRLAVTAKRNAD
jgi:hypothetical protein